MTVRVNVLVYVLVVASILVAVHTEARPDSTAETDEDCLIPCPYNFDPVCGGDGTDTQMFANSCFMERHNCEYGREFRRVDGHQCIESEFVDT